ncbi:MAG TPA: hypothetical protein VG206_19710 [Terriglobia bacterium]|nr:hypothetical protein [Terriglobia bacterium]
MFGKTHGALSRSLLSLPLLIATLTMLAGSTMLFAAPQRSRDPRASSSKGTETITGRISTINRKEGIVVLVRSGPSEPSATQLSWTESREPEVNGVERSPVTASQVPGETDYAFKVTPSTLIVIDGRRTSLDGLASSPNKAARVRYRARRTGDFALEIRVGR